MKVIQSISEMMHRAQVLLGEGQTIGFVPTMGALHEGHLSLVRSSTAECTVTVCSIFVNPTQFGPGEDLDSYPRTLERDMRLLTDAGCDYLLVLDAGEMYPDGYQTWVEVENLTKPLCGANRPVHFRGVTTVVAKLFNIVSPHRAYFGWKDAQQLLVIRRMVKDLNFGVEIVACPTVRDTDGLALSSRNAYLSGDERRLAGLIPRAMERAKEYFQGGGTEAKLLLEELHGLFDEQPGTVVDYLSLVRMDTLEATDRIAPGTMLALAVKVGSTRLIDNMIF